MGYDQSGDRSGGVTKKKINATGMYINIERFNLEPLPSKEVSDVITEWPRKIYVITVMFEGSGDEGRNDTLAHDSPPNVQLYLMTSLLRTEALTFWVLTIVDGLAATQSQ